MTAEKIEALGYKHVRLLPAGGPYGGMWIGLLPQIYTVGLFVIPDEHGYLTRFCYETWTEAVEAVKEWDGRGWPPGFWIKAKPSNVENPLRATHGR